MFKNMFFNPWVLVVLSTGQRALTASSFGLPNQNKSPYAPKHCVAAANPSILT